MDIATIGVDLAKRVLAVHGVDWQGNMALKKTLRRDQVIPFFTKLSSCTVAMKACGGAHYWARKLQSLHHQLKLIAPQFVKPSVKGNNHDAADAAAICEAASRTNMRFVAIKSETSQVVLALHHVRSGFVKARTAQARRHTAGVLNIGVRKHHRFSSSIPSITLLYSLS